MPQLTWLGDTDARRASRRVAYRILEPVETVGDPKAENLLIQGDNLHATTSALICSRTRTNTRFAQLANSTAHWPMKVASQIRVAS